MGACLSLVESSISEHPNQNPGPNQQSNSVQNHGPNPVQSQLPPENQQHIHQNPMKVRLSNVDPKTVPKVPFQNQLIDVFVHSVTDGDTVAFLIDLGSINGQENIISLSLRLEGLDTPESRAGAGRLPEEKAAGLKAKQRLKGLVNGHVKVKLTDWDKYGGRCLGDIYLADGKSVVEIMITEGYGRPYHGEKKEPWTLQQLTGHPFNITERDLVFDE